VRPGTGSGLEERDSYLYLFTFNSRQYETLSSGFWIEKLRKLSSPTRREKHTKTLSSEFWIEKHTKTLFSDPERKTYENSLL